MSNKGAPGENLPGTWALHPITKNVWMNDSCDVSFTRGNSSDVA